METRIMHKKLIASAVAALGLLSTGSALAQSDYNAPWRGDFWGYVGVSGGESKFRANCPEVNVFRCDTRDTGWKVYGGGQINRIFGLEVGYTDFGRISAAGGETSAWAVPISLTAGVPLGDRFNIFAKGGGVFSRTDVRTDLNDTFSENGDRNGWGWTYGAGLAFNVTRNLQIRADWDRYKLDFVGGRRDIDLATAGLQWRF
jgi:OOP family OmpA-OmpF porin